jgi:hypothetical protein
MRRSFPIACGRGRLTMLLMFQISRPSGPSARALLLRGRPLLEQELERLAQLSAIAVGGVGCLFRADGCLFRADGCLFGASVCGASGLART